MLFHAGGLTVLVRASLAVFSLKRVTQGLRRTAKWLPRWSAPTPQHRRRAVWAARVAGQRLLPEGPCLTQALVLQYLLLRRGDDSSRLHIGVARQEDEGLRAHAWVERDGRVLIGGADAPDNYERLGNISQKIVGATDESSARD